MHHQQDSRNPLPRTTVLTPGQFIAGLIDFGPGRSKLFPNNPDEYNVHYLGGSEADVTEGSADIWERLYYDWSDPNCVVLTTIDSNVWECGSSYTYTFTRQADGTTDIDVRIAREGKNFRGWVLGFVLRTIGRHVLERAFQDAVKAIETRTGAAIPKRIEDEVVRVPDPSLCRLLNTQHFAEDWTLWPTYEHCASVVYEWRSECKFEQWKSANRECGSQT